MKNFTEAPTQTWPRLRKAIPSRLQPFLRGLRKRMLQPAGLSEPFKSVFPFTQVHQDRQKTLLRFAYDIDANQIPGAIVECGVLDGGTAALMAYGSSKSGRQVHLFDSWAGLPDAGDNDGAGSVWSGQAVGSQKRVRAVMNRLQINPTRVWIHRGWFQDTFPKARIAEIALLHIDADFYDSVKLCLETWVPRVSRGGYIQIDDYSCFIGCKKAVDEYLSKYPNLTLQSDGQAFFIKLP